MSATPEITPPPPISSDDDAGVKCTYLANLFPLPLFSQVVIIG